MSGRLAHALRRVRAGMLQPARPAVAKQMTTGLTGLARVAEPRKALIAVYNSTLDEVKKMPETAVYRTHVEKLTESRLQIVQNTEDVNAIEEAVDAGQIEEVLQQAQYELELAQKMLEWKPWEPLEEEPLADQWKWP